MAKGGKTTAKTAAKAKASAKKKYYNDKEIKPVQYIDRDLRENYIAAQYDNGEVVEDASGTPIKWSSM